MARISRNVLKGIVKECLVEILNEGLTGTAPMLRESKSRRKSTTRKSVRGSNEKSQLPENVQRNLDFESNIKKTTEVLTDDPVLSSIFKDTARTTLQEQVGAETSGAQVTQGDRASRDASSSDPAELFSESADRWASLAFSDDLVKN